MIVSRSRLCKFGSVQPFRHVLASWAWLAICMCACCHFRSLTFLVPAARNAQKSAGSFRVQLQASATEKQSSVLQHWLQSLGGKGCLQVGELEGFGLSLVAGPNGIKAGEPMLSVPHQMHISPFGVRASLVGKATAGLLDDDDSALIALGLLAEMAKGDESSFKQYIEILPDANDLHSPLVWSAEERSDLRGSHLYDATEQTIGLRKQQWNAFAHIRDASPKLFPLTIFNEANWLWAHGIVLTRALPFGNELSLIPGIDFANHAQGANNTCSIGIESADGGFVAVNEQHEMQGQPLWAALTAGRDHAPGEQVFIDYDGGIAFRLAWEMVYTYGFLPGEDYDEWLLHAGRPVHLDGVLPQDPLKPQKQALLQALGADEDAWKGLWHDVRPSPGACRSMAPLLRLAHIRKADIDSLTLAQDIEAWRADPKDTWAKLHQPLSPDNEARVAHQVIGACEEALAQLPSAAELRHQAALSEQIRPCLAARVMLGEREALETCLHEWQSTSM